MSRASRDPERLLPFRFLLAVLGGPAILFAALAWRVMH